MFSHQKNSSKSTESFVRGRGKGKKVKVMEEELTPCVLNILREKTGWLRKTEKLQKLKL